MKQLVYILLFGLLGLLVATVVHAVIEIPVLRLITGDMARYGDSWLWRHWEVVHGVGAALLWLGGLGGGLYAGVRFWRRRYESPTP